MTDLAPAFSLDDSGTTLVPLLPILRLLVTWRDERRHLGDDPSGGAVLAKAMLEACILDLETTINTSANELLSLGQAARESALAPDRLLPLLHDGVLANAGDDRTPHIRRADLPTWKAR